VRRAHGVAVDRVHVDVAQAFLEDVAVPVGVAVFAAEDEGDGGVEEF
jgi:hypothetical protein